jgi:hypothetical protein
MKAQSAIEFITSYSWAFLLIIIAVFLAYYYITAQQPKPECRFGTDIPCTSFQFFKNSSGGMKLIFQLSNGMSKVITLNGTPTINVTNIGKAGSNIYNGSCWSNRAMIQSGDSIYCSFNITDNDSVPSINKNVGFDVAFNYIDCETSPNYPRNCTGGMNRTAHGSIFATFESRPSGFTYCGDGICNASQGETCATCPYDCGSCVTCDQYCTFGGMCNISCLGQPGCLAFYTACNNIPIGNTTCSNQTGGTANFLTYQTPCCNYGLSTNCSAGCSGGSCRSISSFITSATITITDPTGAIVVNNAPMYCVFDSYNLGSTSGTACCNSTNGDCVQETNTANQTKYVCTYQFTKVCGPPGSYNATVQFTHTSGWNGYDPTIASVPDASPPPPNEVVGDCQAPATCATDPLCRTGPNEAITSTIYTC